ncbi:hypothetical protein D3C80_1288440 [compost metagenome]
MEHQCIGIIPALRTERSCNRRRDGAAYRACGTHLHQHDNRKHQRHRGQCVGTELADEVGFDEADRGLDDHYQHVGCRQAQNGRYDGCF